MGSKKKVGIPSENPNAQDGSNSDIIASVERIERSIIELSKKVYSFDPFFLFLF
jgi:hypothetical protein